MRAAFILALFAGCIDFVAAESEFCRKNPDACREDGVVGGGVVGGGVVGGGVVGGGVVGGGVVGGGVVGGGVVGGGVVGGGVVGGGVSGGVAGGTSIDAGPMHCQNSMLDEPSGETDVDCGGPCAECDVDKRCLVATDCQTRSCQAEFCSLVTAGPGEPGPGWRYVGTFDLGSASTITSGRRNVGLLRVGPRFYLAGGWITLRSGSMNERTTDQLLTFVPGVPPNPLQGVSAFNPMMMVARGQPGIALSPSGEIYVFGGSSGLGAPIISVESFSPSTMMWTARGSLPSAGYANSTVLPLRDGGALLVASGRELRSFDFNGTYADAGPSVPFAVSGAALHPSGDLYLFASDGSRNGQRLRAGTSTFGVLPPSANGHLDAPAVFAPDNRFYVVGPGSGVEAYSPSGDWAPVATMNEPHSNANAAIGEDGRVYVFFGFSSAPQSDLGYSRRVEAYGPVIEVTATSGMAGDSIRVSGDNFAANARVRVFLGPVDGGILLRTLTSSDAGTFSNALLTVPDAGTGPITVIDSRSRYPVTAPFLRR